MIDLIYALIDKDVTFDLIWLIKIAVRSLKATNLFTSSHWPNDVLHELLGTFEVALFHSLVDSNGQRIGQTFSVRKKASKGTNIFSEISGNKFQPIWFLQWARQFVC